ncbi:nuclear transport factor 2 family protein [Nocardia sp. NPDC051570]|uniref:nuclear transport factor 2 family protein n=1 Tax=Nocardia sp. NPDC051570 TaxID=3364324 RepID=UPI0037B9D4FB
MTFRSGVLMVGLAAAAVVPVPAVADAGPVPQADYTASATRWMSAWNITDPDRRLEVLASVFAPDGRYINPLFTAVGPEQINARIGEQLRMNPGFYQSVSGQVFTYGRSAAFRWEMASPSVHHGGWDGAAYDEHGMVTQMVGGFDH